MVSIVESLRLARKAPGVLKIKLSNIRSKYPDVVVLVFEGPEDLAPYTVWIRRIDGDLRFESIVSSGKRQVLGFRAMLQSDRQKLRDKVYFFIDRDFDDLRGHSSGPDLFVTRKYSIENELVTTDVVRHLLGDLFSCGGDCEDRDKILELFQRVRRQFLEAMVAPNIRLFRGVRLGIPGGPIEDALAKYVTVTLRSVLVVFTEDSLRELVPLEREPGSEETVEIDEEFRSLHPMYCRRGKFLYSFLVQWLDELADARRKGDKRVFSDGAQRRGYSREKVGLGALAAVSGLPEGLAQFVSKMAGQPSVGAGAGALP